MTLPTTASGNKGLALEEGLIFEQDTPGMTAVDLPPAPKVTERLGAL